ncbi:MAG: ABC transporter substrate-binding protein [Candidatus Sungiibacteriota bacterium]|uniref:ABC transporter substrate-binding protein n=1 Tax=Candidatus Sungiibacteriota bacterium TaxID=2750080 RepID=A0A7T5RJ27_9BACT|nr:MAG: ABC transporter substrate-binding protein [Candidatus Sungbacteria bacterium]
MDKKVIIGIIVLVILVAGYFILKSPGEVTTGPVKIGFIGPLTGDAATYGEPLKNMIGLAVGEINDQGGINGRKLEVVYEDGKCSGPSAASAMQKLVNVDKVKIVIGGFCSSESLAAQPIAAQNKVFLFSAGSSSPDLTNISKFFVRNYPSDATQGTVLADVAYNQEGWRKTAFIQEQLDYPLGIYKTFAAQFTKLGGTVVKEEFPTATTDFRSHLTKLRGQNPDALFIDTQTAAAADRIMKQVQELKWKPRILLSDAVSGDPSTISKYAQLLEGALAAEFGVDSSNPKFKSMIASYRQVYGAEPPYQSYAQTEYDAVYMIRDAIAAVGYDGKKVAEWTRRVKNWPGASGMVTIGDNGDRVGGHVPKIIRNGKVEIRTK